MRLCECGWMGNDALNAFTNIKSSQHWIHVFFLFISDINECTTGTDPCGDNSDCTNTPGSYTCACLTGYEEDEGTCVGMYYSKYVRGTIN